MADNSFAGRSDRRSMRKQAVGRASLLALLALGISSCSTLGANGPTTSQVRQANGASLAGATIQIINVTDEVVRQIIAGKSTSTFFDALGEGKSVGTVIGRGDVLDISLWEAPPAVLFGSSMGESRLSATTTGTARNTTIPEQLVDDTGTITIPFVGPLKVIGRNPRQIENEIVSRLAGKAHAPQAVVRIARNTSATVTVVGEVGANTRVPLTPRGERLLDVLASAGGVKQPVNKTTIQISRAGKTFAMPLEQVIRDPQQNIRLAADDVVTAYFQPYSFISLGATGGSAEVNFESTGITLAQALGRIGGLRDDRANPQGVFIFRLEDPSALDAVTLTSSKQMPDGKIPVIYRVDLRNPTSFFIAQSFPIRNSDVLYVSNAKVSDLQKFINIVSSMVFSIVGITNTL